MTPQNQVALIFGSKINKKNLLKKGAIKAISKRKMRLFGWFYSKRSEDAISGYFINSQIFNSD